MNALPPFPVKFAVFTSGTIASPLLAYLKSNHLLASIILHANSGQAAMDEYQQAGLPCQLYNEQAPEELQQQLLTMEANVGIVFCFPAVLPPILLDSFTYGFYNLHASPLPLYRGPMPLYWQLRDERSETTLTLHYVSTQCDTGDIVWQQMIPIHPHDTLYSLSIVVARHTPCAIDALLALLNENKAPPPGQPQQGESCYAPRPNARDISIDWLNMSARQIAAMARAGNPAFGAGLSIAGQTISLLQATPVMHATFGTRPGTLIHSGEPDGLIAACKDNALRLDILSCADGIFSGVVFAERFQVEAGMQFTLNPS